ncbi:MAG: ATP synthase F1 subunit epsilon [Ignavibacteria bacterium RIFOXYA2_FULL_37_17]|nr:MAG: ATP synthase F1 subunit epsilon [Ignavibacteria bacterium RIFOXYB2_FULL_36_7]OGV08930.1 MAG: ATP synthase F1 subunit epsilon [Ignavibacteria bacterium RIFOXYA2_FULL_37_17]
MKEIFVEIITPSKSVYKGLIKSVTIPGTLGNFQVLFNHAPMLSTFEIGKIKLTDTNDKEIEYATSGGTVEVNDNKILILADSVETSDDIDIDRARKSYERAKERLASTNKVDVDVIRAEASLQRAINRMKFVNATFSH